MSQAATIGVSPVANLGSQWVALRALVSRQIWRTLRSPGKFIGIAMNPVVMVVVLGLIFKDAIRVPDGVSYPAYVVAGVAVQVGVAVLGPTAISAAIDRKTGLSLRSETMPIPSLLRSIALILADLAAALVALLLVSGIGLLLGWRPAGGAVAFLGSLLLLATFYAAMLACASFIGELIDNPETIEPVGALLLVLFSFCSTVFLPAEGMPGPIRAVAELNPASIVATSIRQSWGQATLVDPDSPLSIYATPLAWTFAIVLGVVFLTLTAIQQRRRR
ncbi:MAG: ABC transporter permease [Renibacterium sp.]|nr:ABC transporter permease [Renibacterium sp.]